MKDYSTFSGENLVPRYFQTMQKGHVSKGDWSMSESALSFAFITYRVYFGNCKPMSLKNRLEVKCTSKT